MRVEKEPVPTTCRMYCDSRKQAAYPSNQCDPQSAKRVYGAESHHSLISSFMSRIEHTPMALFAETRLGPYEILTLGARSAISSTSFTVV